MPSDRDLEAALLTARLWRGCTRALLVVWALTVLVGYGVLLTVADCG